MFAFRDILYSVILYEIPTSQAEWAFYFSLARLLTPVIFVILVLLVSLLTLYTYIMFFKQQLKTKQTNKNIKMSTVVTKRKKFIDQMFSSKVNKIEAHP